MAKSFLARRVLLEDLASWRERGWCPAITQGEAVGCVPICAGDLAEVLIILEPADDDPAGDESTPEGWEA